MQISRYLNILRDVTMTFSRGVVGEKQKPKYFVEVRSKRRKSLAGRCYLF